MIRHFALCLAAILGLTTGMAQAADLDDLTEAEREAFRAEVRAYLLDNPEVIFEAVEIYEQRQAAQEAADDIALVAAYADEIFNDGYSWVGGNPEGDVTLVEFLDYRCGFCRRAVPELDKLLASDGNIRLIVKEFPILGEASVISSRFAVATRQVAGDEAYKQVHDALIAFSGEPTDVALGRIAEGLDLAAEAILAQMDSDEVSAELRATRDLAQRLNISGTPTFVLGDALLRGFLPADRMAAIVAEQRAAN